MMHNEHVIICGLGHVGFRVFELLSSLGMQITVISDRTADDKRDKAMASGCRYLEADAQSDSVLLDAGIREAHCIMALTDDDLANISIINDARRLNPAIRIIARMYDTELGAHIAREFRICNIFSTSSIAAPVFINALAGHSLLGTITLANRTYSIHENSNDATTKQIPLHFTGDNSPTLYAAESNMGDHCGCKHSQIWKWLGIAASPALGKLRKTVALIMAVVLLAALFLSFAMPIDLIDAIYFVTTTITTVGYGDISFMQAPVYLKLFGCLLMLSGALLLTVLFSTVTDILLSEKLTRFAGGLPVPKSGHLILTGASKVGVRIAQEVIEKGEELVILQDDKTGEFPLEILRRAAVIGGSPRSSDTLARANIAAACGLIAVSDNDVENLGTALAAKKENSQMVCVARLFDATLGAKLQGQLSIDRIMSVSAIAAPYFAAAALGGKIHMALVWRSHLLYLKSKDGRGESIEKMVCVSEILEETTNC